ncbi:MAG: DUF63 family protein [Candidatus Altiarchaeota archaeon]|nr:DUF63 family protein [Candidatus Altiarchaeota archaeon]
MLETLTKLIVDPIFKGDLYNPLNTAIYAVIFILSVEAFWKLFAKREKQNELRSAALPFIILGGLIRFADSRWWPRNPLTVTPGVFFMVLFLFLGLYKWLGPKKTRSVGVLLSILVLAIDFLILRFTKVFWLVPVLGMTYGLYLLFRNLKFMDDVFAWVPHIFEAWITSFGVYFGLIEEHVLARSLMEVNPFLFGLVKTLLIPVIMYLIKDTEKKQRFFVGTIIGAIGIGPGLRDLLEFLSL